MIYISGEETRIYDLLLFITIYQGPRSIFLIGTASWRIALADKRRRRELDRWVRGHAPPENFETLGY